MPLVKDIHVDAVLTNISQAVSNDGALVAPKIWPIVPVKKDSDVFFKYDKSNLRVDVTDWAPKAKANEVGWNVAHEGYKTQRHALQELVEDDEKQNQDSPIDVMADSASMLTEKLMIRREKRLAEVLDAGGSYEAGADITLLLADQWDNYSSATSDPSDDVAAARGKIFSMIGKTPNTMVIPQLVYEKIREHPKVMDRIKYTQVGVITPQLLATLFDIPNVIIAGGIENTAIEGQTDVITSIWGKRVYFGYVSARPALRQPSWGYHLQSQALVTDRWRDEERKGDVIRVSYKDVPKLVTKGAGYIIRAAIA